MGQFASRFFCKSEKETRILILGFPGSGKTTVLYVLKEGQLNHEFSHTIGFNLETVIHNDKKYSVWDIGGGDKISALWPQYYHGMHGVIYLIDSTWYDDYHLGVIRDQLHEVMTNAELRDVPILVFANKQDHPDAMPMPELREKLELAKIQDKVWEFMPLCGKSGDGLREGFTWLTDNLQI